MIVCTASDGWHALGRCGLPAHRLPILLGRSPPPPAPITVGWGFCLLIAAWMPGCSRDLLHLDGEAPPLSRWLSARTGLAAVRTWRSCRISAGEGYARLCQPRQRLKSSSRSSRSRSSSTIARRIGGAANPITWRLGEPLFAVAADVSQVRNFRQEQGLRGGSV